MVTSLYMIELRPDPVALLQFLSGKGLEAGNNDEDLGYGVHSWLAASFGDMSPKPWRLLHDRRRPSRILGYGQHSASELRKRMQDFADPGAFAVCANPETDIVGKPMPAWQPERHLSFEVQCCPVGRKSKSGVEKDMFLIHADSSPQETLGRSDVYCSWARQRLERGGVAVTSIHLAGFRLVRQTRRAKGPAAQRRSSFLIRPQALFRGELTVHTPDAFTRLLAHGVGRHRAFGQGMLLLRPPT